MKILKRFCPLVVALQFFPAFFPVTGVRNWTEIVQMNFLIFGGLFWADFPPVIDSRYQETRVKTLPIRVPQTPIGVRSLVCVFGTLSVTVWSLFLMLLWLFSSFFVPNQEPRKGGLASCTPLLAVALWVPMYFWGQYPWIFFASLAVTLDSTETPLLKPPFLGSWPNSFCRTPSAAGWVNLAKGAHNIGKRVASHTICTETITNENLEILFRFRFRNGKANRSPQIFFRFRFRNDHVGHAQAAPAGFTYEINSNPRDFLSLSLS